MHIVNVPVSNPHLIKIRVVNVGKVSVRVEALLAVVAGITKL